MLRRPHGREAIRKVFEKARKCKDKDPNMGRIDKGDREIHLLSHGK